MLVGKAIGPFVIDREIGHGAMGTVYHGFVSKTRKPVAVKMIGAGLDSNPAALARFERECEFLKKLRHPNIVRLYATGRYRHTPFYVMEFIEGETLQQILQRRGRFPWDDVLDLGKQICSALQHAHDQGIIHRDLKPSNIMLTPDGKVKLTDFGIAKGFEGTQLTSTNHSVGTASYMSPEQCRGEKNITHKSDLYSLGIVFYELLTGRRPFEAETPLDMFLAHTKGSFERPARRVLEIPIWLDTLVCQMMEKKPEQRPFDATMVAQSLERVEERVSAKRSAGVEVAVAPAGRAPAVKATLADADKETARLLRIASGKKPLPTKRYWFYERAWFQALALTALLAGIVGLVYWVVRPADPHRLYTDAQALIKTGDWDKQMRARDGPIKDFLRHYADRQDEEAKQMLAWADQVDLTLRERQLRKRMSLGLSPDDEAEKKAVSAVRHEEAGDVAGARERWQALLLFKELKDPENRPWGLLAEKRLADLNSMEQQLRELQQRVELARNQQKEFEPADEREAQAARALRFEVFGDFARAKEIWGSLPGRQSESGPRAWILMAAAKIRELTPKADAEENLKGVSLVRQRLKEAAALKTKEPAKASLIYRDIVFLYEKNSELADEVGEAVSMLASLTMPEEPKKP
jgi:eukaryotic-like serine/threonine-protein kinase